MALPASDSFTGTNGASLGSNWTDEGPRSSEIQSNSAACNTSGSDTLGFTRWNADTFDDDQYSEATLNPDSGANGNYCGVSVRVQSGANSGYEVDVGAGDSDVYLVRVDASSVTVIASSSGQKTNGATYRIEAEGTALTTTKNGSAASMPSATDSTYSSGYAGISFYDGNAGASALTDDWGGGNLAAAAQNISPNIVASEESVYNPSVSIGQVVEVNLVTSDEAVYNPSVAAGKVVEANLVASDEAVYQPEVKAGRIIEANLVTSEEAVYAPSITQGAQIISPTLVQSDEEVYNPAITRGVGIIYVEFVTSDEIVYRPSFLGGDSGTSRLPQTLPYHVIAIKLGL